MDIGNTDWPGPVVLGSMGWGVTRGWLLKRLLFWLAELGCRERGMIVASQSDSSVVELMFALPTNGSMDGIRMDSSDLIYRMRDDKVP